MKIFNEGPTGRALCVSLALFGALAQPVLADSVPNVSALGPNDSVVWGVAAPNTNQFSVLTTGGLSVTLSEPNSDFMRIQQFPPGGWAGNFPAGTQLITPQEPSGPITITFAAPILGFGVTIDDAYNNSFTGIIQAFGGNTSLNFDTLTSNDALMFLGVLDATADITSIQISTTNVTANNNFAFGNFELRDALGQSSPPVSNTPEPASVGMALAGLAGIAMVQRRGTRKA